VAISAIRISLEVSPDEAHQSCIPSMFSTASIDMWRVRYCLKEKGLGVEISLSPLKGFSISVGRGKSLSQVVGVCNVVLLQEEQHQQSQNFDRKSIPPPTAF
jgi:hypothetical protein